MRQETRPWGRFEVLYEDKFTWLKRIIISPGQSLSYQYHLNRSEFWLAETSGVWAEIEGKVLRLQPHRSIPTSIYPRVKHRLFNPGVLEVSVLEWTTGQPREDDIVRLEDDYGRV